jgi:hypothetical protein
MAEKNPAAPPTSLGKSPRLPSSGKPWLPERPAHSGKLGFLAGLQQFLPGNGAFPAGLLQQDSWRALAYCTKSFSPELGTCYSTNGHLSKD